MDVYKIAVSLAMTSNAAQVLQVLSAKLLGVHTQVNQLQGGLNRLKVAIGGAFAVGGAVAGLKAMGSLVEHGNDLVKVQRDMAAAGVDAMHVQEAYAKSWQMTAKYQNMSAVEVMKMQNDARMTFGDQGTATHHIEDFVAMASFLKAYQGGKHAQHSEKLMGEVNAAMKSGEIAGKISPEDLSEHVKQLTAMKVAYGEQVKITQYLAAQRAGGVALRNTSDEFRYGMFPALVQENGVSAGTMLMTAFNKIVAGTGNRTKSLEHMADIGALKKDQLEYDKIGRVKGLKDPSAIMNNHDAAVNFGDWVMKTFKPLIDAKTADPIRQAQMISAMFPDRNAAKAITEIIQQYRKLAKDAEQMHKARQSMNTQGYTAGSFDYQTEAFRTRWTNLMDALGAPIVATATAMLARVNEVMGGFSQWAKDSGNAATIKTALEAVAWVLGGTLVAGATALLVALGPIPLAIGAVVAGIGYLAVHWTELKSFFANTDWLAVIKNVLTAALQLHQTIFSKMIEIASACWQAITGAIGNGLKSIEGAFSSFISWLATVPGKIAAAAKSFIPAGLSGGGAVPGASVTPGFSGLGKLLDKVNPPSTGGASGSWGGASGGWEPGKQSMNVIPPPRDTTVRVHTDLHVDGQKMASVVTNHQVSALRGPSQGAPYFDATHGGMPSDFAMA